MAAINCPLEGCQRVFNTTKDLCKHTIARHSAGSTPAPAALKLTRPTIEADATPAAWANFVVRFTEYCTRGNFATDEHKVSELSACIPGD